MGEAGGIGLYNSSTAARAKPAPQAMQWMPDDTGNASLRLFAPRLPAGLAEQGCDASGAPMRHYFDARALRSRRGGGDGGRQPAGGFERACTELGLEGRTGCCRAQLLAGDGWLLAIPRSQEHFEGISMSAVCFGGAVPPATASRSRRSAQSAAARAGGGGLLSGIRRRSRPSGRFRGRRRAARAWGLGEASGAWAAGRTLSQVAAALSSPRTICGQIASALSMALVDLLLFLASRGLEHEVHHLVAVARMADADAQAPVVVGAEVGGGVLRPLWPPRPPPNLRRSWPGDVELVVHEEDLGRFDAVEARSAPIAWPERFMKVCGISSHMPASRALATRPWKRIRARSARRAGRRAARKTKTRRCAGFRSIRHPDCRADDQTGGRGGVAHRSSVSCVRVRADQACSPSPSASAAPFTCSAVATTGSPSPCWTSRRRQAA